MEKEASTVAEFRRMKENSLKGSPVLLVMDSLSKTNESAVSVADRRGSGIGPVRPAGIRRQRECW